MTSIARHHFVFPGEPALDLVFECSAIRNLAAELILLRKGCVAKPQNGIYMQDRRRHSAFLLIAPSCKVLYSAVHPRSTARD